MRLMSMLAIIMVYVGINIDTFIALLFVIRRYRILTPMVGFILAEMVLWIIGVVLGKTITTIFPDWITGLMGFVLLYLAFRSDDQEVQEAKNGIFKIFFLCLSLGHLQPVCSRRAWTPHEHQPPQRCTWRGQQGLRPMTRRPTRDKTLTAQCEQEIKRVTVRGFS